MKGNMADYFTNFSLVLPMKPEQREYAWQLVKQANAQRWHEEPLPKTFPPELGQVVEDWGFEMEMQGEGIWLHSQYGGQDAACVFIQHLLKKFEFAGGVAFEWSHDCSQPKVDAFGGGAAFVTANEIETFTTSEWLRKMTGET
jgi:hypothetical protein